MMFSFTELLDAFAPISDWEQFILDMYGKLPKKEKSQDLSADLLDADDVHDGLVKIIDEEINLTTLSTEQLLELANMVIQLYSNVGADDISYKITTWCALIIPRVTEQLKDRLTPQINTAQFMGIIYSIEKFSEFGIKSPDTDPMLYKQHVEQYHKKLQTDFQKLLESFKEKNMQAPVSGITKSIFDFLNSIDQAPNQQHEIMKKFSQVCFLCNRDLHVFKNILDNYKMHVTGTYTDSSQSKKLEIILSLGRILDSDDLAINKLYDIATILDANQAILQQDSWGESLLSCILNLIAVFFTRMPTPSEYYRSQFAALKAPHYLENTSNTPTDKDTPHKGI